MYFCLHWWTRKLRMREIRWLCPKLNQVKSESEIGQSCPTLCDPMDCSLPGSSVMGFSRQEYWIVLPFPSPGDLPNQGSNLGLLHCRQTLLPSEPPGRSNQVVLVIKNPPASAGDIRDEGSIPGSGRCPGVGNGNPLQYSCLENPMDRGAWRATVHEVAKLGTIEHTHTVL